VAALTLAAGAHQPIALGIHHYIGNNNQQWNAIMATAVIASIPRRCCSSWRSVT
jgi:multiple sugar transport system permease protein